MADYTIFGGGPAGLYTAWRLLKSGTLNANDKVTIYEWGDYDYENNGGGTRAPAGRVCSYHYQKNPEQSYIEVGGMRFTKWDNQKVEGHQLVNLTIDAIKLNGQPLKDKIIDFNTESSTPDNTLFYLRGKQFCSQSGKLVDYEYSKQLSDDSKQSNNGSEVQAPYNTPGNNNKPADHLLNHILIVA